VPALCRGDTTAAFEGRAYLVDAKKPRPLERAEVEGEEREPREPVFAHVVVGEARERRFELCSPRRRTDRRTAPSGTSRAIAAEALNAAAALELIVLVAHQLSARLQNGNPQVPTALQLLLRRPIVGHDT